MTFTPPPRKEVLGAWNITVVLYCLHPIGGGFWYIVVTNLVKFEIARNDLAKAAALWGLYEFISKASRLITGSTIGAFSDRYGRKPVIAANFLAAIIVVNIMFFIPSTGTLFLGAVITGVFDVIDVSIMALVSDCGRALAFCGGWRGEEVRARASERPVQEHKQSGRDEPA